MRTTSFVEHEIHARCPLTVLRKEDDGTTVYFDASHGSAVYERPAGQSIEEWYAAHRAR